MNLGDLQLFSTWWKDGMFLQSSHFQRQEAFYNSQLVWMLRYTSAGFGLVGSGPRTSSATLTPDAYDPVVQFSIELEGLRIGVRRCRGVTLSGGWVDIPDESPESKLFGAEEIPDQPSFAVYVLRDPLMWVEQPIPAGPDTPLDEPDSHAVPLYEIRLEVQPQEEPYALMVGRILNKAGRFELDGSFIPPCMFMTAHTVLLNGHGRLLTRVQNLLSRFIDLQRAVRGFAIEARNYEIESMLGADRLSFVGNMIVELQGCLYAVADPVISPRAFFTAMRKLCFSAGIYLQGSLGMEELLGEIEEQIRVDYYEPLASDAGRRRFEHNWRLQEDLGSELKGMEEALAELEKLEGSLEPQYTDYRVNEHLPAVPYQKFEGTFHALVDYKRGSQTSGGYWLIVFRRLQLNPDHAESRLVLMLPPGQGVGRLSGIELFYNNVNAQGAGDPCNIDASMPEQFNYAVELRPMGGQLIKELVVKYPAHLPLRGALIYERKLLKSKGRDDYYEQLRSGGEQQPPQQPQQPDASRAGAGYKGRRPYWEEKGTGAPKPPQPQAPPRQDAAPVPQPPQDPNAGFGREFLSRPDPNRRNR